MALLETVAGILAKASAVPLGNAARRNETIIRVAKIVGYDPTQPSREYEEYYVAALVECFRDEPEAVLALFRDQYVKAAFRDAASTKVGWDAFRKEVRNGLERNRDNGDFGHLPPSVDDHIGRLIDAYHLIIDRHRPPHLARLEGKVDLLVARQAEDNQLRRGQHLGGTDLGALRFAPDPAKEHRVLSADGWKKTLRGLYPDHNLVTFGGHEFPIWASLAESTDRQRSPRLDESNGPMDRLDDEIEPSFATYDLGSDSAGKPCSRGFDPRGAEEYYYLQRRATTRSSHNGAAYAFERIKRVDGHLRIDARSGTYFDSVATSEMLEREFINAQSASPDDQIDLFQLHRREWLHNQVASHPRDDTTDEHDQSIIFDGRFRAAALSVATTMIFTHADGSYSALLVPRSKEVLTHPGYAHVAPSGIFAPISRNWRKWGDEFSIEQTVVREYAEELFGYKDLEDSTQHIDAALDFVPPIRRLRDAVRSGVVEMRYCGITVPLLTLRTEICVLIFIRDSKWFDAEIGRAKHEDKHPFAFNWEYRPGTGRAAVQLDLDRNFEPVDRHGTVHPTKMVPHAAAALHLSTEVARQIIREESD
ncbi:hypothetical protein ABTW72_27515 [Micromonospora sp. NPDC127501]|uniref:hypothetical protein n=1 Tax=Micromonospora sp. NPDC127501 TaxID=3154872 RepID=UPI00332C7126